jgi:transcriptional regulator of acetoin/glycerol metabolism
MEPWEDADDFAAEPHTRALRTLASDALRRRRNHALAYLQGLAEGHLLQAALEMAGGNPAAAARRLGIAREVLVKALARHRLVG